MGWAMRKILLLSALTIFAACEEKPKNLAPKTEAPLTAAKPATAMAMSFAITALRAPGVRILDPECTAKTFPDFFERLASATHPR